MKLWLKEKKMCENGKWKATWLQKSKQIQIQTITNMNTNLNIFEIKQQQMNRCTAPSLPLTAIQSNFWDQLKAAIRQWDLGADNYQKKEVCFKKQINLKKI